MWSRCIQGKYLQLIELIELILFFIPQSDSGGPLTYKQGDQRVLIGDVSGGSPGGAGDTHFYARISFLREWIDTQLGGANYCPNGGPDTRS